MAEWTEPKIRLVPDTETGTSKTFSLMEVVMRTGNFADYLDWLWECYPGYNSLSEVLDRHVDVIIVNE